MRNFLKEQFSFSTVQLTAMGFLTALEVILNRFVSVNLWNMKLGFAFAAVMLAGMLLGPVKTGIVGAGSDLIGAILFPSATFFPGFTLTALIRGLMYGALLGRKRSFLNIFASALINEFVLALFVTSFWIATMYGTSYIAVVVSRLPQAAVLFGAELAFGAVAAKFIVPQVEPLLMKKASE